MRNLIIIALLLIAVSANAEVLKILPLGDSITVGEGDSPEWFGYRDHLQDDLNQTYDFVGPNQDPSSHATYDVDHLGEGAQRTESIESNLTSNLVTYMSDVDGTNSAVLIHAGTNDIIQDIGSINQTLVDGYVANVEDMIDYIQSYNAEIDVYVALIIPSTNTSVNTWINTFNTTLSTMLTSYSKSNLYEVDMYSAITANGSWSSALMSDQYHPNDAGYQVISTTWANAINANYAGLPIIKAETISGVAPLFVSFYTDKPQSSGSTRSVIHDNRFVWDFGEESEEIWGTDGASKDSENGHTAAHVFETSATVTLTEYDYPGFSEIGSDTLSITVTSQDAYYPTTATTCVSTSGTFTDCPTGANQVTTSDITTLTGYADAGERILFRRGESWTLSSLPSWPNNAGPVVFGAYGTCTNPDAYGICDNAPQITSGAYAFHDPERNQNVTIQDLRFVGTVLGGNGAIDMQKFLLYQLDIEDSPDIAIGWTFWNDATPMTIQEMAVVSCKIVDSGQHAMYIGGEHIAVLGNYFDDSGTSHLVRVWQAYYSNIRHNIFSRPNRDNTNGRLALKLHGPGYNGEDEIDYWCDPTSAPQCLENPTAMTIVSDNVFGGSANCLSIAPQNGIDDSEQTDIIFERNLISAELYQGNTTPATMIAFGAGFSTVRNNIFDATGGQNDIDVIGMGGGISPAVHYNHIYNNTIYRGDYANDFQDGIVVGSTFTNTVIRNNIISFPNIADQSWLTAINDSGTSTTVSNNTTTTTPYLQDPDNVAPLSRDFSLTSSSTAAINQGYSVPVYEDFDGNLRDSNIDIGAFEYGTATCSTTPSLCSDQSECETAGWNWCTDTCQSAACGGGGNGAVLQAAGAGSVLQTNGTGSVQ